MKPCASLFVCLCLIGLMAVPAQAGPEFSAKFGHDQTEQSPHHAAALLFKKLVEEGSAGRIEVAIFPSQTLGTGIQMAEMVQAGALEFLAAPTAQLQALHPPFQVLDLPFLCPDKKTLYEVLYGQPGQALFSGLEARNILGLTYWGMGFKQFTGNFPIRAPADFKGKKIRVMPSPVIREQFLALGASPVPINFHELYGALQQGVVDGQENPLVGIATMKLYEVQKYMALSNHAFLTYAVVAGKGFLEGLPPELRQVVRQAADQSAAYQLGLIEERDGGFLATIKAAGVEVAELSADEREAFKTAMAPVYAWFEKNVPNGQALIAAMRP